MGFLHVMDIAKLEARTSLGPFSGRSELVAIYYSPKFDTNFHVCDK